MNIWALPKARAIKHLMLVLTREVPPDLLCLRPDWQDDCRAITLCKPDELGLRAYVYTFGQKSGRYGVHLEYPYTAGAAPAILEDLTLPGAVTVLREHFDILL